MKDKELPIKECNEITIMVMIVVGLAVFLFFKSIWDHAPPELWRVYVLILGTSGLFSMAVMHFRRVLDYFFPD